MLLSDWIVIYINRQLNLKPKTIATYKVAVGVFIQWVADTYGSPPRTRELSIDLVSDWLAHLSSKGLMPKTINSYRSSLNAVWGGAIRLKHAPPADTKLVPSCRIPRKIPIAWSMDDLGRLIDAAKRKTGRRKNEWQTVRRDFWAGLYLFLYDTGARFGAALDLESTDVDLERQIVLLRSENSKTITDQLVSISDETAEYMGRLIAEGHKYVWPNGANRQQLYDQHKALLRRVGLPSDRYHMFHCFRKTTATQLAIKSSVEAASKLLGHSSVALTNRVYVDQRQLPMIHATKVLPRPCADPDDDDDGSILKFRRLG